MSITSPCPRIQFDHLVLDQGSVYATGEPVRFAFSFDNLGDRELIVESVHPSCACLEADYPREPILPGGKGKIVFAYNPGNTGGPFLHEAIVKTNDPTSSTVRLRASGYVSTDVKISPASIDFGDIPSDHTTRRYCIIQYHNTQTRLRVNNIICSIAGADVAWIEDLSKVPDRTILWPEAATPIESVDGVSAVVATFNPTPSRIGKFVGTIAIKTNIDNFRLISIPVRGNVLTPIILSPSVLSFGEVKDQGRVSARVGVKASSGGQCRILEVKHPRISLGEWRVDAATPGAGQELLVTLNGKDAKQLNGESISIVAQIEGKDEQVIAECPVFAY